jgi:hypothetical protein
MKAYYWLLAVLSVCALIVLFAPALLLILMFTGVGVPLAVLLGAAPAVAAVLLPAAFLQATILRIAPGVRRISQGGLGVLVSIGIVLAVDAGLALSARQGGLANLEALLAEDRKPDTPPSLSGTVGIVVDGDPYGLGLYECPDLCQRLLLTGSADQVVLAHANNVPKVAAPDKYATVWRMERRDICPEVALNTNTGTMAIHGEPEARWGATRPVDLMNLKIAAGNCLIREEATYGRPDFTILHVNVRSGPAMGSSAALFRHEGADDVLIARQTVASADVIGPLLLPVPEVRMQGPSRIGLWRQRVTPNEIGHSEKEADFASFLTGTLGLDLALVTSESGSAVRDQIRAVLDQPGPLPDSFEPLVASFLQSFPFGTMTDAADQDLLLRILARPEISLPWWTSTGLPRPAPENTELYGKVADLTFARLPVSVGDSSTGEAVDGLIDRLPAEVIKARSDTVLRLAADPKVRLLNSRIVSRLSGVGSAAGPLLIDLLQEPERTFTGDLRFLEHEAWQDQQTWSFVALCRADRSLPI